MKDHLKKIKELSLIEDDKNLRIIMDEFPGILWLTEKNHIVYINKSWFEFTGLPFDKEYSRSWIKGVHPDDLARCEKIIPRGYKSGPSYEIEYRLLHHSGEYRWILEKGKPIFLKDGTFKGFVGLCIDINNQKKIELELSANKEKYHRIFETARDGILILDSKTGEITDVNPFLEQLLGYSKKEFLGKKLWEVGAFKNTKESKEAFKVLQEIGYVRYENLPLKAKNGKLIEVEFVSNAYITDYERVMQCNIRDITERKKAEEVTRALVLLEQEKTKTRFIADATHELRTPLAIIKGNVELALRDKEKNIFPAETFKAINVEINHLAELLSNLTTLTREEKDFQKIVEMSKVNLSELILRIGGRCKTISLAKNITINVKEMPNFIVLGNKMYLEKLFSNIISNAVFYGKKNGTVTIVAKKSNGFVIVYITDDGIGIPEKDINKIFGRFYRTESGKITHQGGTGLGLAIAKRVVDAHGGVIEVKSEDKKGTTFIIKLPLFK